MQRNLLLAMLACAVIAAETESEPSPTAEIALRKVELGEAFLQAKPGTLIADPAAAECVAHVRQQLELAMAPEALAGENPLGWLMLIAANQGEAVTMGFYGVPEMPTKRRENRETMAFTFDLAARAGQAQQLLDTMIGDDAEDATLAGLQGKMINGEDAFIALTDNRLVIGSPKELERHLARRADLLTAEHPASGSYRSDKLMSRLQIMQQVDKDYEIIFALFPSWLETPPSATMSAGVEDGSWVGSVDIMDLGTPLLRTPAMPYAAGHAGEHAIQLVAGVDMDTLRLRLSPDRLDSFGMRPGQERDFFIDVLDSLSGDLALSADWQFGPVPVFRADLGLVDVEAFDRLVSRLSEEIGPMLQPLEMAGYQQAWQVPTPLGIIQIGLAGQRLTVTTQPQLPDPNETPVTTMEVKPAVRLDIDLPKLSQVLMPMAYGALGGIRQPLMDNPLRGLRYLRWPLAERIAQRQEKPLPGSLSALFEEIGEEAWAFKHLSNHFPEAEDDPGAWIDAHCCVFVPTNEEEGSDQMLLVARSEDGFLVFDDEWRREPPAGIDQTTLETRTEDMERLLGKAPAELAVITVPEIPTFSAQWLPPLDALHRHMPTYHLQADVGEDGGLQIDERGLPLIATNSGFVSVAFWAMERSLGRHYQWRLQRQQEETVEAAHPGLRQALQPIAHAIRTARNTPEGLPDSLSGLVTAGHLELAMTADLAGGHPLAEAAELDRIGSYDKDREDAIWAVGVGNGWAYAMRQWGGVELTQELGEVPGIPDDLKTTLPQGTPDF